MDSSSERYTPTDVDHVRRILIESADELSEHVSHDTLSAYVDDEADPANAEIVESHMEECRLCREDLGDLRSVRHQLERHRLRRWVAAAAVVPAAAAALTWFTAARHGSRQASVPTIAAPAERLYESPDWQRLVAEAVQTHRLPSSEIENAVRGVGGPLRGQTDAVHAELYPTGVVIDSVFPRFRWPAKPKAFYGLTVGSDDEILFTTPLISEPEWQCDRPLARGRTYTWQVEVHAGTGPSLLLPTPSDPAAVFHIVSAAEHANLQSAVEHHPNDHLLLAVLFAHSGMRPEAMAHLRMLAAQRPTDIDVQRLVSNTLR